MSKRSITSSHHDMNDELGGARAVEVATMLGDSVVSVKHCMDPRGGKVTRKTWGVFAASLVCLASSAIAFKMSVDNAAYNKGKLDYHTRVANRPAYSFRPTAPAAGLDFLAFGGLALGLLGMTTGLIRMRNERKSPFFRVGTAPGVEQPLETAPAAEFPLVAPSGDDFVFNYGAGIDGEMIVGGTSTPLAELAATGRARPSATIAGAIEVPLPMAARIRARSGNTTFLVTAMAQPRKQAVAVFGAMESRTMAYFAGSLAVHLGVWAFLQTVPVDGTGVNMDFHALETAELRSSTTERDELPPEQDEPDTGNSGGSEGAGAKMALAEGAAGKPDSQRADGHIRIKNNQKEVAMSRVEAIEAARTAGILGSVSTIRGGISSMASTADFSSGFDDADIYGPLFGSEGEGRGNFGGGRSGWGLGGGCTVAPCGIIGTGRYGTIGTGDKAGDRWCGPGGSWCGPDGGGPGMRRRTPPDIGGYIGRPIVDGDLDKAIIKRYMKRNVDKIAYCYEKQLLAKPGIAGTITVQFLIAPNGSVQSSTGTGFDGQVSSCVASVVKNISFPAPKNGGAVQVNYPFNFHAAGQ